MSEQVSQRLAAIREALKAIQHYPGASWPNAFDIEGALLRDVHARREQGSQSPWVGGTLAAAKFIASAPEWLEDLLAEVAQLQQALDKQTEFSARIERERAHYGERAAYFECSLNAAKAQVASLTVERDEAVAQQEKFSLASLQGANERAALRAQIAAVQALTVKWRAEAVLDTHLPDSPIAEANQVGHWRGVTDCADDVLRALAEKEQP